MSRPVVGLVIAAALYALVKFAFVPFRFGELDWSKQTLIHLEAFMLVIVAGSVILTELIHLSRGVTPPNSPHPVGWRDVATLLLSTFASFLLVILAVAIAQYLGVEIPDK